MAKIGSKTRKEKIEINEQFKKALELLENSSKNIFITGRAGTGKSTLLEHFRNTTKKKVVVLAPTGVAALNVKGQTIHSFFGFKINVTLEKIKKLKKPSDLYKKLDVVIIDEISMVRADLLDCVDKFLRLNSKDKNLPFGGVQMVFIGDLYQLPPVVTRDEKEIFKTYYDSQYFFDAKAFPELNMEFVELEKIYRQKDTEFISLLNAIRNKSATEEDINAINARLCPDFNENGEFYIHLTTTNKMAEELNTHKLSQLKSKSFAFKGKISGSFEEKYLPTQINLKLKVGAQVMFLNNDSYGLWVNGSIGKIVDVNDDAEDDSGEKTGVITVELAEGQIVEVSPYKWKIFRYTFNKQTRLLDTESVGSFTQFPIKLAWAITIHKSQGKTFDKVILDIGHGTFAHGQVYVALSRCTSLEGLVLKKPIAKKHIFMDYKVVKFLTKYQYKKAEETCSVEEKAKIIAEAIANKTHLNIVYLKANDAKSSRRIAPKYLGEMEYLGKAFLGVSAFCQNRKEDRTFRVDRILQINTVSP